MNDNEADSRNHFNDSLRLLYSGALGISVVAFSQLLQQDVTRLDSCSPPWWITLGIPAPCLTVSIYCFALSIPLMAVGILLLTDKGYASWPTSLITTEVIFVVGSVIGLLASFVGTFFLFLHFYGAAAVIFVIASVVAFIAWRAR